MFISRYIPVTVHLLASPDAEARTLYGEAGMSSPPYFMTMVYRPVRSGM